MTNRKDVSISHYDKSKGCEHIALMTNQKDVSTSHYDKSKGYCTKIQQGFKIDTKTWHEDFTKSVLRLAKRYLPIALKSV